ncbi:MAG: hypothetical protein NW208_17095 [Bryobacter sp.]|nr:hypothetical protein [Bryobacter sp.]
MSAHKKVATPILPFTAKYRFGWQVAVLLAWPAIIWFFLGAHGTDGRLAFLSLWDQGGIVKRLGILFLLVLVPGLPLEVFRARTVFLDEEIRHLPTFGRWRKYRYQDIVDLEVFPNEFSRLEFQDGRVLKIWAMRADPEVVEAIIRQKWQPEQVIRSKQGKSTRSRESA